MKFKKQFCTLILLVSTALVSILAQAEPSKLMGIHPLIKVNEDGSNVAAKYRPYLDAFGMIRREVLHRGMCTATHLGNGYVMSAGHCFGHDLKESEIQMNEECEGNEVHWGGRNEVWDDEVDYPDAYLVSKCTKVIYSERIVKMVDGIDVPIRDFAIFKVDRIPRAAIAPAMKAPPYGTPLASFSYPQHRPLEMASHCIVSESLRSPFMFWHQCDSEGGSSGAAMVSFNAKGILEVVGIHNGSEKDPLPFNYATLFSAARDAMLARGINIDQLLAIPQTKLSFRPRFMPMNSKILLNKIHR
jgi:V8-like Glu-specific endopeptidase